MEAKPKDPQDTGLKSFEARPPLVGSVDWYLAETNTRIGFVDLRLAGQDKAIDEWMSVPHPMRAIGSTYDDQNENYVPVVLKGSFDGLFFIDRTTRARPIG